LIKVKTLLPASIGFIDALRVLRASVVDNSRGSRSAAQEKRFYAIFPRTSKFAAIRLMISSIPAPGIGRSDDRAPPGPLREFWIAFPSFSALCFSR
jgi:hypothetical protein